MSHNKFFENEPLNDEALKNENDIITQEKKKNYLTAAYTNFRKRYLVCEDVFDMKALEKQLGMIEGNTTHQTWELYWCCLGVVGCVCICPYLYYSTRTKFQVKKNCFALVESDSGQRRITEIYGPGYHILGRYKKHILTHSFSKTQKDDIITSSVGDISIAVIEQGTIMHFEWGGQNLILGPGTHLIRDPLTYVKTHSLDSFYIEIGPEKWVTVPEGYDGISVNLGELRVLNGGEQHHLSHVGDKFVKMVPKMLQSDRVPTDIPAYVNDLHSRGKKKMGLDINDSSLYLKTTTSEGSTVILDTMVFWRIVDTYKAAKNAMEILVIQEGETANSGTKNISQASRNINYLRIVKHHLTTKVGHCSVTGNEALTAKLQQKESKIPYKEYDDEARRTEVAKKIGPYKGKNNDDPYLYDEDEMAVKPQKKIHSYDLLTFLQKQQDDLVKSINKDLEKIGVLCENICIYSVIPMRHIQEELDKQTKARVDFNTKVIEAKASAVTVDIYTYTDNEKRLKNAEAMAKEDNVLAQAEALEKRILAEGEAEAIEEIAKARKGEAEQLKQIPIASDLARIRVSGEIGENIFKGQNNNFVFGENPGDMVFAMMKKHFDKR